MTQSQPGQRMISAPSTARLNTSCPNASGSARKTASMSLMESTCRRIWISINHGRITYCSRLHSRQSPCKILEVTCCSILFTICFFCFCIFCTIFDSYSLDSMRFFVQYYYSIIFPASLPPYLPYEINEFLLSALTDAISESIIEATMEAGDDGR